MSRQMAQWRREFGEHLRAQRLACGLSQEALADRAGVRRQLIYRTEVGQTSPHLDTVVQLADALGMTLADLVTPTGDNP